MSNVDLLNWVEPPKNPSFLYPSKIIVKADTLTVEPEGLNIYAETLFNY